MSTTQNPKKQRTPLVDYVPSELRKGTKGNWMITFSVLNPFTKKLERQRRRVKPMNSIIERERFAKQIILSVNEKLRNGWNPITDQEGVHSFTLISDVVDTYIKRIKKQVKDKSLRPDTLRTYVSQIDNFKTFLKSRSEEEQLCINFDKKLIIDFLDTIYYERDNGTTSYNNYLAAMVRIGNYMLSRGFIKKNTIIAIPKKVKARKQRIVIPPKERKEIFEYLRINNPAFGVFCMAEYYELLRPAELTKLKISDISLFEQIIHVRPEVSKTKREAWVRILEEFMPHLVDHIKKHTQENYVFSADGYKPGKVQLSGREFTRTWTKMRKKMKLNPKYQLYSLKDTGITDMLHAGVPAVVVRDHARHADLSMTNKYVAVAKGVDADKINNKVKF